MTRICLTVVLLATALGLPALATAQSAPASRLPSDLLDIQPPSARITGRPGEMRFQDQSCRSNPNGDLRSRIVNAAVQEWGFFGFAALDYTREDSFANRPVDRQRWSLLDSSSAERLAASIAGYWAATPNSGWILQRQNDTWKSRGMETRWRDPWSAAFISWVMCESGLGEASLFARAIAHHTYIDQAIRARDGVAGGAAFVAYDSGEKPVVPGDLLCRGSRPDYRSLAERRRHLGEGARTHCDIVVKVDTEKSAFHVIGGNVRGTVGLKLLPGELSKEGYLKPVPYGSGKRRIFAHLALRADTIPLNALDLSPTLSGHLTSSR
jgi:hypothetical protein